jgi:hypothetical protein
LHRAMTVEQLQRMEDEERFLAERLAHPRFVARLRRDAAYDRPLCGASPCRPVYRACRRAAAHLPR